MTTLTIHQKEFEKLWKEAIDILPAEVVKDNINKIKRGDIFK